jgi:molybdopterin-binding protein
VRSQRRSVSTLTPIARAASPMLRSVIAVSQYGSERSCLCKVLHGSRRSRAADDLASWRDEDNHKPEEEPLQISARNKLPGKVTNVNAGEAIANVELEVSGMRLIASVTVEAVRELGIEAGKDVTAVIKASDVMLGVE